MKIAAVCLMVLLTCSCHEGGDNSKPNAAEKGGSKLFAVARGNEGGTADTLSERKRAPLPSPTDTSVDPPESPWGTRGLLPITDSKYKPDPKLLEDAADVLGAPVVRVWAYAVARSSKKVFHVHAGGRAGGERGWFIERDGRYVRLDSGAELIGINEVLSGYPLAREDFNDPAIAHKFLKDVLSLNGVGQGMIGSSHGLAMVTGGDGLSSWLHGTETNEAALRELCRDPVFAFEGNRWRITFNLFRPDGRVDQFTFIGRHDPQNDTNRILRIDMDTIRPPGSFSYPLVG